MIVAFLGELIASHGNVRLMGGTAHLLLVQVGLREHLQELAAAALVDGHG
jgi:hypothetical protein